MEHKPKTHSLDRGKTVRQLYTERAKRLEDAMELKQPDRIPVQLPMSYMLAELGGITNQEFLENPAKAQELLEKAAVEFQPDSITGTFPSDPRPFLILGDRMTRWPGHGLEPNGQYQFAEHEFMKAEDYDKFLEDPGDWAIRVYLPRAFKALEGFSLLPPLGTNLFGSYNVMNAASLADPTLLASFEAYYKVIKVQVKNGKIAVKNMKRMAALGFPSSTLGGMNVEAPFDFMSDTLRGMRGIMLDILQRPEKLLAAEEKVARIQLRWAIDYSRTTGLKAALLPLHRGSDGFMSLRQFERFYWPQLKSVILTLIENGIRPGVFYEGVWDQRLKYLDELPKGKTVGWFQASDIFKVKEVLGDTMCIIGGMSNSMLQGSTTEKVREYTRKLCRVVGKGGGFIMDASTGLDDVRPENVRAFFDYTREYGVY